MFAVLSLQVEVDTVAASSTDFRPGHTPKTDRSISPRVMRFSPYVSLVVPITDSELLNTREVCIEHVCDRPGAVIGADAVSGRLSEAKRNPKFRRHPNTEP